MKITKIETLKLPKYPRLLFVKIHTDAGIIGLGETYDKVDASRAAIHSSIAPVFIGNNPLDINRLWNFCFDNILFHGFAGAELRALSALEIALWDILGKYYKTPLYKLLGGSVRNEISTYNTCIGFPPVDDYNLWQKDAGIMAQDMWNDGITGVKIWPFDKYSAKSFGHNISDFEINKGLKPIKCIREKQEKMRIGIECHFRFNRHMAEKILKIIAPYNIYFVEDPMPATSPDEIKRLSNKTDISIVGSETLFSRWMIKDWITNGVSQIIMTDVAWTGGIMETVRIANLAEAYNLPIMLHNAGGPIAHMANLHLAAVIPNFFELETVRAFYKTIFPDISNLETKVNNGFLPIPGNEPGLGIDILSSIWNEKAADIQVSAGKGKAVGIFSIGDAWDKTDCIL